MKIRIYRYAICQTTCARQAWPDSPQATDSPFSCCILLPQNNTFFSPVVGGTGIFSGAKGTTNVTPVEEQPRPRNMWRYDVQLKKPPSC